MKSRKKPAATSDSGQQQRKSEDPDKASVARDVEEKRGFELEFAPPPPPDQCETDDEVCNWVALGRMRGSGKTYSLRKAGSARKTVG